MVTISAARRNSNTSTAAANNLACVGEGSPVFAAGIREKLPKLDPEAGSPGRRRYSLYLSDKKARKATEEAIENNLNSLHLHGFSPINSYINSRRRSPPSKQDPDGNYIRSWKKCSKVSPTQGKSKLAVQFSPTLMQQASSRYGHHQVSK